MTDESVYFPGTRIPKQIIAHYLNVWHLTPEQVKEYYPSLDIEDIKALADKPKDRTD